MTPLRIGTRGSALALWQARHVAAELGARGHAVELAIVKTAGDRLQDAPLSESGGKRLFVKEIEDALYSGDIDLAVHSAKDMSATLPEGLTIGAALAREDPRDALVLPAGRTAATLGDAFAAAGDSPAIGTGSVRRVAQMARLLPRARFAPIRGNVDTRLRKLDAGGYDALILAAAGLMRLGFAGRVSAAIPPSDCIPAPGQGIIAIEIREHDEAVRSIVAALDVAASRAALAAERAIVTALGGGCQLPLGALALPDGADLDVHAIVASIDGRIVVRRQARGPAAKAADLGARLADDLLRGGARTILDEFGSQHEEADVLTGETHRATEDRS